MNESNVLLKLENLSVYFPMYKGILFNRHVGDIKAVDRISFDIREGETLGLVGESGCGKSTTGKAILRLVHATSGSISFQEKDLLQLPPSEMRETRKKMQMVFQDPFASLNPRMTVEQLITEPLIVHNIYDSAKERDEYVVELMRLVGLNPEYSVRFPSQFSGGQRQRICIARALALHPKFVVCDEPISALDVSIQAQIINLFQELQEKLHLTYLFIAHDLSVVRHISDRVAVMYLGKIVELAERAGVYDNPQHPYTQALLSAVPIPDPDIEETRNPILLEGDLPSPADPPKGCNFCTRCPQVMDQCRREDPPFKEATPGHFIACHLYN